MKATQGSKEKEAQEELKNAKTKGTPKTDAELSAIEKIRKLMEFNTENGATEAEIENAMKLAQRLMLKHNLELGDIELTTTDISETSVSCTWKKGTESKLFLYDLLSVVAEAFSCKVIRAGDTVNRIHKIVGLQEDREMTEATFHKILPQVRHLTKARYKESDKKLSAVKFTISYQAGFISGLSIKLAEDKTSLIKSEGGEKFELIIVSKDALINNWLEENLKIKEFTRSIPVNKDAFEKGKADGADKGLSEKLPAAKKKADKKK